ncbi:ferric reductase-like transmembrane domain-containing protein [Azonexus sp.]|uniref:ferric reductase-like transmembrane domain-containing protein n=1 Tax=Azonexus sp. TaxID=1872668 RepID=UPI0035B10D27
MSSIRLLSIPLFVLAATAGPVYWALPQGLGAARSLGIVSGWAGCGLLLASLALMLREPWLAHGLGGLERMYRWHHRTGIAAYVLLLLHPLLLAAESLPGNRQLAWQTLTPFGQDAAVWLGWLSLLLLMAGLALTFEKRLAYRLWRGLHVGLGIAVVLGFLHLLMLGIALPAWLALGLAVVFLGWRFVRDDFGLAAHPYVVDASLRVARDMVEVSLKPLAAPLDIVPGQFVLVAFLTGAGFRGCGEFHPYTVSGILDGGIIRLGIKALGDCTRRIQSVGPGVPVRIQGAFGDFLGEPAQHPQLWVAGGIGITPFLARLRERSPEQPTLLLYLYRTEQDAAFVDEIRAIAAGGGNLSVRCQATGEGIPDADALLPDAATLAGRECYLCGPPAMVGGLTAALRRRGVTARHLHFENFEFR